LLDWEFLSVFQKNALKEFPKLEKRVENTYCYFWKQSMWNDFLRNNNNTSYSRYRALNPMAWNRHKTLEFRLFPALSVGKAEEQLLKYLEFVRNQVKSYLKGKSLSFNFVIDESKMEKEVIESV
jgi:hypothetical protein